MFTGIVEEMGSLRRHLGCAARRAGGDRAHRAGGTRVGDSILTDGVCLTVTGITGRGFRADVQAGDGAAHHAGRPAPGRPP